MSHPTAWITGAGGLIGNQLACAAPDFAPGWRIRPLTRDVLDLADLGAVDRLFHAERPALILHCAAMSRVADCEANPERAELINVRATAHLSNLAAEIPFVFFSTDLVFDGVKGHYTEDDAVHPLNIYAETKARSEVAVLRNPRHTVVRTSLNAGISPTKNRSFSEDMRRAWERGQTLSLFTDEYRNPIHVAVTARAVWALVRMNRPGLYHLAGRERMSRWEIGQLLAARWPDLDARMSGASLKDYSGPRRSPDTSLNCARFAALLDFPLLGLREWMAANPDAPV
jgi:dTDP-4-dehydrorhamnose reductase